jgi:hypothetical protein
MRAERTRRIAAMHYQHTHRLPWSPRVCGGVVP